MLITADKFVVSTGSTVSMPNISGLDRVSFKTSDDVLNLTEVPKEVVVLGGGIVACELAQFLSRVGSKVIILQRSNRILKDFSEKASSTIENKFKEEGIELKTGVSIKCLKQLENSKTRVDFDHKGESLSLETEFLFHALGRSPATEGLNLDQIGVEFQKSGHIKNKFFSAKFPFSHLCSWGLCRTSRNCTYCHSAG